VFMKIQDFASPISRPRMKLYPDESPVISEVQNAEKLLSSISDDMLTPMVRNNGTIYYINELVLCADNRFFIPKRFFTRDGTLWARGHPVTQSPVSIKLELAD
jgi:hypothetical protein